MSTTFASSSSSSGDSPSKRSRLDSEMPEDMDESAQSKIARKEARVIRNRESAQRSRNQRKHYLANLEVRNRELEEENRRLRAGSSHAPLMTSPCPTTTSVSRESSSPEQNVITLAGELGIPPQMVSSGVSLSSVAPPPHDAEVHVKQESIPTSASTNPEIERLNQRISMLEDLLKRVVAVSNFGIVTPPPSAVPVDTLTVQQPVSAVDETFDFTSFLQSGPSDAPSTPTPVTPSLSNEVTSSFYPVACHSAAVATLVSSDSTSDEGRAPQRARGTRNNLDLRLITRKRLDLVARVLVALAISRGWVLPTHSHSTMGLSTRLQMKPTIMSKVGHSWDRESRRVNNCRQLRLRNNRIVRLNWRIGKRG